MGGIALSPHKVPLMGSVHCGGGVLPGKVATNLVKVILLVKMSFPCGPVAKIPHSQFREHKFDPWLGS